MDVATRSLGAAEAEIERFIARRADKTPDPDELEPSYAESVRRYHARRREANRWEWVRFYDRMAETHAGLSKEYAGRAEQLFREANE